jgi:hypothetical protein
MLARGSFTTSHRKCLKSGILKEFWGPFGFFCMECRIVGVSIQKLYHKGIEKQNSTKHHQQNIVDKIIDE